MILENGQEPRYGDHWDPMAPPGWAADTTDWRLDPTYPYAVRGFRTL